jgi:hypothetical protein
MLATTVIHIRNRKPGDVYIGRSGSGEDGYFGNPYRVGARCSRCGERHSDAESTLPCFREYFLSRLKTDEVFKKQVRALRGKRLVCFCKPGPCHGDIIAAYCNHGLAAFELRLP